MTPSSPPFEHHIDEAYQRLRSSLTATMLAARGQPTFPQDLARHLKINKNLAWRVSRIIESRSPTAGVPHLPGTSGMKLVLEAARRTGASAQEVARVEAAHAAFKDMIALHAGDQATFELLLDSHADDGTEGNLLQSRRLAFRGNSGIWGIQAKTKLTACFMAPNADDPSKIDTVLVGGFVDLVRLRPLDGWPLFRIRAYGQPDDPRGGRVDPAVLDGRAGMIDEFTQGATPDIRVEHDHSGLTYRLGPGRVGRTGAFTSFFSRSTRGVFDRYATDDDRTGEFYSVVEVPVEAMLFDLFIHPDLACANDLQYAVFGRPAGGLDDHAWADARQPLPITVKPERLPGTPTDCVSPLCGRYPELIEHATQDTGWNLDTFSCHRFVTPFPPFRSTVLISFPLGERANGSEPS